jgi:hypothetical protein
MRTLCIVFLVLTGVANTFGQCGTTQACRNQKFPYRFCPLVNNRPEVVCTDNPTSVPGKKPFRNVLPICARIVTGPDDPQEVKMKDANGVDVVVYSPAQLQADIDSAVAAWNCLCGFTQQNMQVSTCCTEIVWTRNPRDFSAISAGTFRLGEQQTSVTTTPPALCGDFGCFEENGVRIPVGRRRMYLNNTDDFRSPVGAGPSVTRMLYSGPTLPKGPGNVALSNLTQVWSLRDVLTHELGHWAGMMHPDAENPPNYTLLCDPVGAPSTGLMTSSTSSGTEPKGLSDQDKCQFMRLYCPTITGIEEEIRLVYATRKIVVVSIRDVYRWKVDGCDGSVLRAWSVSGEEIQHPVYSHVSDGYINVYCHTMPRGVFVLSLTCTCTEDIQYCLLQVE